MKKFLICFIACTAVMGKGFAQDKDAYKIYTSEGKKSSYSKILKAAAKADVVFFGEYHNNSMSHWLELELTRDLWNLDNGLVAGAEMFEADQQALIDEYFSGKIDQDTFEKRMRNWPNYETDYKPVLEFIKEKGNRMVATNIPRKFARLVSKGGFAALDTLADKDKAFIAPLPIEVDFELPSYKEMIGMMGGHGADPKDIVRAQAIKDATMAHFILKNFKKGSHFIHLNGAYHSDLKEGIVWYLKQANPGLKVVTITTREYADISVMPADDQGAADFIIAVPETMTKTY